MTAIAGFTDGKKVWIGADSAGSDGGYVTKRTDTKVFSIGKTVFGFTSSFRMGQILQHHLELPEQGKSTEDFAYMVSALVPAVREVLHEHHCNRNTNNEDDCGTFIVGRKGKLFIIHSDYQVEWVSTPYAACGSGRELCMGAMHSMMALSPRIAGGKAVAYALAAAEEFNAHVASPYHVICV